ncbi:hypothetical protein WMF12_15025 [Sorangium sp. So ce363]
MHVSGAPPAPPSPPAPPAPPAPPPPVPELLLDDELALLLDDELALLLDDELALLLDDELALLLDDELALLLDDELAPPLPATDTSEGLPEPFAQNPNVIEAFGRRFPFQLRFEAVSCPFDEAKVAFHWLATVAPLRPTTTRQLVVFCWLVFLTVTFAQ